jgi:hypothetical protein
MFWLAPDRFDDLTRALGATTSRRQALRLLVAGLAASLLARPAAAAGKCVSKTRRYCLESARAADIDAVSQCLDDAAFHPEFDYEGCMSKAAKEDRRRRDRCDKNFPVGKCDQCEVCKHGTCVPDPDKPQLCEKECCPKDWECCPGHPCCNKPKGYTCQNDCGCCPPGHHTCKHVGTAVRCAK